MATLVLSAVGTLVGGPLGGAIGALVGRQVDAKIIGSPVRDGPRLTELAVSTSSYGQAIAQVHGTMRIGGTMIWATELAEHRSTSAGKGQPKTANYSYTASFAVALSSRPIARIGRIWADGNLLRGAAGDLKAPGTLRLHCGHGDQPPDPLIASAQSGGCPAFRGIAYAVFEDLDLTSFGNRIPSLSFEVTADDGDVTLAALAGTDASAAAALDGLLGFALDGGSLADGLATIGTVYPLVCEAGSGRLALLDPERPSDATLLPEAVAAREEGDFGGATGRSSARQAGGGRAPEALRYYDPARDYQPGIQRSTGAASTGGQATIEFPGVLSADRAKALGEAASQRARWSRERMSWRMAELDPAIAPGSVVRVPGRAGEWLVTGWEWREAGIELELMRRAAAPARSGGGATGNALPPADRAMGTSTLAYFELPADHAGASIARRAFVAAGSTGAVRPVALFASQGSELLSIGGVSRADASIGSLLQPLGRSHCLRIETGTSLAVRFASGGTGLRSVTAEALADGANRLLVGEEVVQFARAEPVGDGEWQLSGLLRGRGGTEWAACRTHEPGTPIVLLDDSIAEVPITADLLALPTTIAALGLGDEHPVEAVLRCAGASTAPLAPVHPSARSLSSGGRAYRWVRRSRGSWLWPDGDDVPLAEDRELYQVGAGPLEAPLMQWKVDHPLLELDEAAFSALRSQASGQPLWVRQIGTSGLSRATLLEILPQRHDEGTNP